jgi:hypothetical protein
MYIRQDHAFLLFCYFYELKVKAVGYLPYKQSYLYSFGDQRKRLPELTAINHFYWTEAFRLHNLALVKLLMDKKTKHIGNLIHDAALSGSFETLKHFHCNFKLMGLPHPINWICSNGHLDIIKFFHFNRKETFCKRAMDSAAAYGHLEIVKFLHENRTRKLSQQTFSPPRS